jgi:hypothetical protein
MIRKFAGWLVVLGLVFYVAYNPQQAATSFSRIGGSMAGIGVGVSDFLAGFASRLGSAQPDQTPPAQ